MCAKIEQCGVVSGIVGGVYPKPKHKKVCIISKFLWDKIISRGKNQAMAQSAKVQLCKFGGFLYEKLVS
jgi:hypothetical protein